MAAYAAANAQGDAKATAEAGQQTLSAIANFVKTSAGQLSFAKGDVLVVVRKRGAWWLARDAAGNEGLVPSNYVVGPDATPGGGAASASQA